RGAPTNRGEDSASQARDELARLTTDYELIRTCGQGSFGVVWIVRDRAGAYRAMKVVEFGRLVGDVIPKREIQALEHYCLNVPDHPNLAQIYHIGRNERWLYYTMELADDLHTGRTVRKNLPTNYEPMTLLDVLRRGRLSVDTAVEIALRLLSGVSCLHRAGLVHRDVKPANIIFVNREVKLTDFSLVSVRQSQMSKAGTPRYMPPDECMDATADTYALGKILYELISGGKLATFPRLPREEQISSSKVDLEKLDAFLETSCARNAERRFATAADMRTALLDCRYPLHDSLLLELADDEVAGASNDPAHPLRELQQAISRSDDSDTGDVASLAPGSATSSKSAFTRASTDRSRSRSDRDTDVVWQVIDRVVKVIPWLVILLLGYYLIYRLTN
ncbi:MAG: serine/threonine protein kinase, partial [Planctomycetes bacterium]|nr:serine/threonine protein kinase [Planctomycetota bacterium]